MLRCAQYPDPKSCRSKARLWNIFAVARSSAVRRGGRSNLGLWIFLLAGLRSPIQHRVTPYSLAWREAFTIGYRWSHIFLANVPSDLSLLAFGIPPAREAESAGGMPKVPKGQGLGRLARWAYFLLS